MPPPLKKQLREILDKWAYQYEYHNAWSPKIKTWEEFISHNPNFDVWEAMQDLAEFAFQTGRESLSAKGHSRRIWAKGYEKGQKDGYVRAMRNFEGMTASQYVQRVRKEERSLITKEFFVDLEARIRKYRKIHAGEGWLSAMLLEMKSIWKVR